MKRKKQAGPQRARRSRRPLKKSRHSQKSVIWSLSLLLLVLAGGLFFFPLKGWSMEELPGVAPIQYSYMQAFNIDPRAGVDVHRFNSHGMQIAGLMNQIKAQVPGFPNLNVFPTRRASSSNSFLLGHPSISIPRDALVPAAVRNMQNAKMMELQLLGPKGTELTYGEGEALDWFWNEDLSAAGDEAGLYPSGKLRAN